MELLIGLIVGVSIVSIIIAVNVLYVRMVQERRTIRHGDGQFSVGKIPDSYGTPTTDGHGGPF